MPGIARRAAPRLPENNDRIPQRPSAPIVKKAQPVAQAPKPIQRAPAPQQQQVSPPPIPEQQPTGFMDTSGMGGFSSPLAGDPVTPTVPDYNSDETYQFQKAELAKAMADYEAQNNLVTGQYDNNFNDGLRKLGFNQQSGGFDRGNMQGLYGQALNDNSNDFAARGLMHSGLFANADSQLNNDFADRKTGLDTARSQFMDTQNMGLGQFKSQQELQNEAYQREALQRILARTGGVGIGGA